MAELLECLPSSELAYWIAFSQEEPFGGPTEDLRAGIAPAALINLHREEGSPPISPFDFFAQYQTAKPKSKSQTPQEIVAALRGLAHGKGRPDDH